MRVHRVLRCAGDELIDRRVSARAGPACARRVPKAEPGAAPGRGGAQRSRLDLKNGSIRQRSANAFTGTSGTSPGSRGQAEGTKGEGLPVRMNALSVVTSSNQEWEARTSGVDRFVDRVAG
jgi:hypothetical protein